MASRLAAPPTTTIERMSRRRFRGWRTAAGRSDSNTSIRPPCRTGCTPSSGRPPTAPERYPAWAAATSVSRMRAAAISTSAAMTSILSGDELASVALDASPLAGRRSWDAEKPWQNYGVGRSGRAVLRGEEIDRFELALGELAGQNYAGYLRVGDGLGPLPIGSQLGLANRRLHLVAWCGVRRDLRSRVRSVGPRPAGRAPRSTVRPPAERQRAHRRAGRDRHATVPAGSRSAICPGWMGRGSGRADGHRDRRSCTCGRTR